MNENAAQRNQGHKRITIGAAVDGLDSDTQRGDDVAWLGEDAVRKPSELGERKRVAVAPVFECVEITRGSANGARAKLEVAMRPTEGVTTHSPGPTPRGVAVSAGRHRGLAWHVEGQDRDIVLLMTV